MSFILKLINENNTFSDRIKDCNLFDNIILNGSNKRLPDTMDCLAYADKKLLECFEQEPRHLAGFLKVVW
jgi:hypothetical protein